jgi:1,4-dihydroxy-6-naphthoate synthase
MSYPTLSLGFSPCPNDTFIFDALIHDRIDTEGLTFAPTLADVEELNRRAMRGEFAVTKLSYHAFGFVADRYVLLNAGSALGDGVGPLLVKSKNENFGGVKPHHTVAIPGHFTTANYLLGLAFPELTEKEEVLFSHIESGVVNGTYDLGVLIHENRFTYAERGLDKVADLGDYWQRQTELPIPLGGIAVSRRLDPELKYRIQRVLRRSVEYARSHPAASREYVAAHAQEMDGGVMRKHIDLYVNDFTVDLGERGRQAVRRFLDDGRSKGIIPPGPDDYLV